MTPLSDTQFPPSAAEASRARRASVAVAVAPLLVLAAFTAVVGGLIEADTGIAVFVACTAWLVVEMYRYQDAIDEGDGPSP